MDRFTLEQIVTLILDIFQFVKTGLPTAKYKVVIHEYYFKVKLEVILKLNVQK